MSDLARALPWEGDETDIVAELQAGSDAAFDWLVTHYHAPVYNVVYRIVGDSADAADVTQEVFLKAFKGIRSFRQSSTLKTWLYRIAIREALNQRRWWTRHLRRQVSINAPERDEDGLAAGQEVESNEAGPFEQLAAREVQEIVHRALGKVSECFRAAVVLRDLEGLSYEEIAEVLEISVGTVKSRIVRGRRELRDLLRAALNGRSTAGAELEARVAPEVECSASGPNCAVNYGPAGGGAR